MDVKDENTPATMLIVGFGLYLYAELNGGLGYFGTHTCGADYCSKYCVVYCGIATTGFIAIANRLQQDEQQSLGRMLRQRRVYI